MATTRRLQHRHQGRPNSRHNFARRLFLEQLEERRVLAGTWQNLAAAGAGATNGQMMMLLTDGSVLVQEGSNNSTTTIFKLSPEAGTGSYVNGDWSDIDDLNEGRLFYTTTMLPDGRVFAVGGEYPRFTNTAEIYDPLADTWSFVAPIPTNPTSRFLTGTITGASNTNPITISTTSRTSALNNGQQVTIAGVGGNTNANGVWTIANLTGNSFDLVGSAGNAAYTAGTGNWASIPAAVSQFGDGVIEMLSDGQVLAGQSTDSFRYNPATDTWTATGPKVRNNSSNEETWVILPDTSILSYDIRASATNGVLQGQRYIRATDSWVDASNLDPNNPPAVLSGGAQGNELGPMFLQPDGNVIIFGANGNNAIYNPTTDLWSAGPQSPTKMLTITPDAQNVNYSVAVPGATPVSTFIVATDDPGAMLPNGHILIALSPLGPLRPNPPVGPGGYSFPQATYIYEYDPVAQTFTENTPPGLTAENAYQLNMVVLPSGQVLLANAQGVFQVYTPDPLVPTQDEWRPVITGITDDGGGTFTLSGLQLNGISEGANYGDDYMSSTNYPIIRLEDGGGDIFYARTFNWSNTGVATGSTPVTTQFTLPAGMDLDDFETLTVIANGIPSTPAELAVLELDETLANLTIRVQPNDSTIVEVLDGYLNVVATYPNDPASLIVAVGNGDNNTLTVDETYGVVNARISFSGGGFTSAPGDRMYVIGTGGDDTLLVTPSSGSAASMSFNDSPPYSFANIQQFAFDGKAGNDTLTMDSSFSLLSLADGVQFDGGVGFDALHLEQTEGTTRTTDIYSVGPNPGEGTSVIIGGGTQTVYFQNLEPVVDLVPALDLIVNATPEQNAINYSVGSTFIRGLVTIDNYESIEFREKVELTINAGAGNDIVNLNSGFTPADLTQITVNAGDGDDSVTTRSGIPMTLVLNGGAGNDSLDASGATAGATFSGGSGDDDLVGGPDDNTFNGGSGFDTISILGTPGNNVIDVRQDNGTTLIATVDGDTRADTFTNVESFRVAAGLGDDIIRVAHSDSLVATPDSSRPFEVVGGGPNASDRLAVRDDGIGDTVVYRKGADNRSGSVTVGPLAPVSFEQIEFLDVTPLNSISGGTGTDGDGRLVVFKPDLFENNNARTAATHLGAGATISVDPVIDPGTFTPLDLPGDQDWFEFIAAETGVLDFQVFFEQIGTLSNGRAGLPGNGNLSIEVYDSSGTPIGSSITVGDNERIAIPAVRNERYFLRVFGASDGAVNVYNLTVINVPAPVPFQVDLQAGSDSGRNDSDNITNDTTTTFDVYLDDDRLEEYANLNLTPDDDFFVEVYNNGVFLGTATFQGPDPGVADNSRWEFTTDVGDLQEGHNNFITAAVRIRDEADPRVIGRGEFSLPLQITLDTIAPSGTAHLFPDSDSGIWGFDETMSDLVTSDMTPLLYGAAEANALVRVALDRDPGDPADFGDPDGTAVAIPLDGDEAFPPPPEYDGNYFLQTILSLADGEHTLEVHFQDVAGNTSPVDAAATLVIFVDTAGPKITNVTRGDVSTDNVHSFDGVTSVFEPKPSDNGPDPLVHSIVIHFSDLPDRTAAFADYHALFLALAEEEGNYQVKGDHNGNIAIVDVNVTFITTPDDGLPEIAQVELVFDQPLPDDRYTVWASDNLSDAAGNPLDGESGALGPFEGNNVDATTPPIFPTGDGEHGGDFWGRFTIDSRPEIGTFALGSVYIDINGNTVFDPEGQDRDYTNRDIAFLFGFRDDRVFAGNFAPAGAASASGFDKLGGYGNAGAGSAWHWRLDFNHDGVVDYDVLSGVNTQGDPVAGNFSATHPGDEIGLFNSGKWWLDAGGDNNIGGPGDIALQGGNMKGQPIVGDFDGDGLDDLGTWDPGNAGTQFDGVFSFDFANNGLTGNAEATIQFDVPGVFQKAIAADLNEDGIDDIGLFVTRREGVPPAESAEWFFLVSNVSLEAAGTVNALNHLFTPVPFGKDVYAQFGDEAALPVVGNFDPPTSSAALLTDLDHNSLNPLDVNNDGFVSPLDSLLVINAVNAGVTSQFSATSFGGAPFLDVNGDNYISPIDALLVINKLNSTANVNPGTGGEGEAADKYFSSLGSDTDSSSDDTLWSLLASDMDDQRRKRK